MQGKDYCLRDTCYYRHPQASVRQSTPERHSAPAQHSRAEDTRVLKLTHSPTPRPYTPRGVWHMRAYARAVRGMACGMGHIYMRTQCVTTAA
jgi:hypothetical protein